MKKIKATICAWFGHSKIQTHCFGYYNCARCGAEVGDTLGSVYPGASEAVVVGHNCDTCQDNYKKLTWRDKILTPNPFGD